MGVKGILICNYCCSSNNFVSIASAVESSSCMYIWLSCNLRVGQCMHLQTSLFWCVCVLQWCCMQCPQCILPE